MDSTFASPMARRHVALVCDAVARGSTAIRATLCGPTGALHDGSQPARDDHRERGEMATS